MSTNYTIKQVAATYGLSEMYVRRAIHKGELKATLEQVGTTQVQRLVVTSEDLVTWRKKCATHARRDDGRVQYKVYLTREEAQELSKKYEFVA